ncbi:hypothetical protein ON010_g18818 [Phytophthora cinnamomi]|nr:hypothetical protein ON010_g18818 [Phytophthora cinnamomi]
MAPEIANYTVEFDYTVRNDHTVAHGHTASAGHTAGTSTANDATVTASAVVRRRVTSEFAASNHGAYQRCERKQSPES